MFSLNEAHRFYLYSGVCDMRKGFDTLCGVVRLHMGRDPLSGEVFIFLNRVRTTVKLLHWEHGGLVIYHKRLVRSGDDDRGYKSGENTTSKKIRKTFKNLVNSRV